MTKPNKRICALKLCNNEAEFFCGNCQGVDYCSQEHQRQDWIAGHRRECGNVTLDILKQQLQLHYNNRVKKRKEYYKMFLAQTTDELLYTVREMEDIEMRIDAISKNQVEDEFELAATVCLHIKTLINMNERQSATQKFQNFVSKNRILSETMRLPTKGKVTEESKKFLINKLNLIATLANLAHNLQMSPVWLFIIYTQNIQLVFGNESLEASNCFFMMGHYYYDEKQYVKSIACFRRAAQMRNDEGAYECYVNIGICYKVLKRNNKAIEMFLKALQRLIASSNEYSNDAAQLNEYLAITYMEDLNFIQGIKYLEAAYLIRNKDPEETKCKQLNKLIVFLYKHLDKYFEDGSIELQKADLFKYLRENVFSLREEFDQAPASPTRRQQQKSPSKMVQQQKQVIQQNFSKMGDHTPEELGQNLVNVTVLNTLKQEGMTQTGGVGIDFGNHKMRLPKGLIDSLDPEQISYLAKLQLELENCTSKYRIISVYNKSLFLGSLNEAQRKAFKQQNLDTLRDMDIANPKEEEIQAEMQGDKKKGKHKKAPPLNLANIQRNL